VRELQSVLKQAMLRAVAGVLVAADLSIPVAPEIGDVATPGTGSPFESAVADYLRLRLAAGSQNVHAECCEVMERHLITQVLLHTDGNQVHAARILGIARNSLRKKIGRLGITIARVVA
jgi:two-component system nitrogen regulation response regulator GlnG